MSVLDVWTDLIQNKRDDVGLYGQEEHIALIHSLFVASCQVHPHFLQKIQDTSGDCEGRILKGFRKTTKK